MKIGFIGLGNVGGKLAGSLARAGFDLTVRDLDQRAVDRLREQGAKSESSTARMAAQCDALITCLPSPAAAAEVMEGEDGALAGLGAGKLWMEMSTTDADEVKRIGAKVAALGADPIDCPVSGGCHRAATGNISISPVANARFSSAHCRFCKFWGDGFCTPAGLARHRF